MKAGKTAASLLLASLLLMGCDQPKQPANSTTISAQQSTASARAVPETESRIYSDKNGYFTAARPKGWEQKDFPEETIRSKVEFINARNADVNIRVIVAPTASPSLSNDEFLAEVQEKIRTALRPRFPSINWTVRKETVVDREAVVMVGSGPGLEQRIVQYINQGMNYSVALNAKSREGFLEAEPTFRSFLYSFTILEGGKSSSEADRNAAQVARFTRLALLMQQTGQTADALQFVDQGLAVDPTNAQLKELQRSLTQDH